MTENFPVVVRHVLSGNLVVAIVRILFLSPYLPVEGTEEDPFHCVVSEDSFMTATWMVV